MAKTIKKAVPSSVKKYIAGFPRETQQVLKAVRATVVKAAPQAEEAIKYGIPTLVFHGNMLSYGAWKNHIGMYPVPEGDSEFTKAIAAYTSGKSSAQFPFDKPLPVKLIATLVKLLVARTKEKPLAKGKWKTENRGL